MNVLLLDCRAGRTQFNETENLRCRAARCRASPTIVGDCATVPIPASWILRVRVAS
ncbi:MAG: hypothetical protein ACREMI_04470 [Gemmatimonadales bacterium]